MDDGPRICDYENSTYRTDFWEGQGREYEDLAERIALRHLLPLSGRRLIDIGGGFGRLSEFYDGYEQVILLDYSRSLLRQAQSRLGRSERIVYVAANFYTMPFVDGAFDTSMMVRVIHHVEDVPTLLAEMGRILAESGTFVLEFASKRHLKAILRYALRRQQWNPFDPDPYGRINAFPSRRTAPLSRAAGMEPASRSRGTGVTSALMNPRAMSEWTDPAASTAVLPSRMVQALTSLSPTV